MSFKFYHLIATISILLIMIACDNNPFDPAIDNGHLMVTHASPNLSNVDVYIDNTLFAKDLNYENSSRYTGLSDGEHSVCFKQQDSDDILLETGVDISIGNLYSLFVCDTADNLTPLFLLDDFGDPDYTETVLRFINLSPNAPAVDVTLQDGTVIFSDIEFKKATLFKPLVGGDYNLQIRKAGTDDILLEISSKNYHASTAHTLWLKGFIDGKDDQALGAESIFHKFLK